MATLNAKKQIKGLTPHEVSMVGRPANKRRALLFKSAHDVDASGAPFDLTPEAKEQVRKLMQSVPPEMDVTVRKSVRQLCEVRKKDDGVEGAEEFGWDPTTQSIMAGVGRIASQLVGKVTLDDWIYLLQQVGFADGDGDEDSDEADNASEQQENEIGGGYVVAKDADPKPKTGDPMADSFEKPDGVDQKTHDQAKAAAMALYNSKVKGNDKAEKDDGEEEEMDKGKKKTKSEAPEAPADERLQAIMKAQKSLEEQNQRLVEKNAEMERSLAEHVESKLTQSIRDQVNKDFRNLGGDRENLVSVIKHMRGQQDENLEKSLMQVLKSANAQLASHAGSGHSDFEAIGSSATESDASPAAQLDALVKAMVQKSGDKLDHAAAYDKVLNTPEGRALYVQHRNHKGA